MAGKSKSSRQSRQRKRTSSLPIQFLTVVGLCLFLIYLWGRVQIDSDLREQFKHEQEKAKLISEISDLRVQNERLTTYAVIAAKVSGMGMHIVPPSRISKLVVDFEGLSLPGGLNAQFPLQMAGMSPPGMR